ncbi:MAG: 3-oxoacyl-[acyl-carrier-protein] synthase [Myxococcales bacterium]|nr:3-oxoacyl-[acyl-carrier-protein] synthase [Myxococcales bacterium]
MTHASRATPWPVAVIGAGCASPAGFEPRELRELLAAGSSQLSPSRVLAETHPGVVGGEVPPIPASHEVGDRKLHRLMSRGARLGSIAARAALDASGLSAEAREHAGWFCGVGTSGSAPDEIEAVVRASVDAAHVWSERKMCERGLKVFHPLRTFALMPNMTLCHSSIAFGVRGPSAAMFSRGAGTVFALVEAAWAIADGDCAAAIAGGADTALDCLTWAELVREGHVAAGLLPGEGAGALVLAKTAAQPIAWVTGAAVRNANHDVVRALRDVLDEVGGSDTYVLAAWGAVADAARSRLGGARVFDQCAAIGDALAAAPALAWCAAVELIRAGAASVIAISAGIDGHITAVRFAAEAGPRVEPSDVSLSSASSAPARRGASRRAVITGVGVVSGLGVGFRALLDGLAAGNRGIRPITCFDATSLAARIAGQVPIDDLDAGWLLANLPPAFHAAAVKWIELGALRDRKVGFALVAAAEAWRHAGHDRMEMRAIPLVLASGLERALIQDFAPVMQAGKIDWAQDARRGSPAIRNRASVDLAARAVADVLGLGEIAVHVSACAAGALSVAHGAALVERGADIAICGASDSMLDPIGVGGMITLGTTSPRTTDLDGCRPFDRRRDGLVLGEGAAVFVVEDEARARSRGARPLARVLGWGASQDAYRPSAPNPDGVYSAIAMRRALERAHVTPADLGYINAHGTGTPLNDVAEIRAIRRALGDAAERVPISSVKGALGHLMAASGSIEVAASLLAFEHDLLPGTANHRERDPECDLDVIGETPREARVDTIMSSSFGFGGQNSVVVLGRPA